MTLVKHDVPWRNSSPKPASLQEGIGNAGETRRFRSDRLQERARQQAAAAHFPLPPLLPGPDKDLERATELALFRQNFPNLDPDDVLQLWSPGTDLANAAWDYYRQRRQARLDRAWDRADEWTTILRESEQWNATSRAGMFKFSGSANPRAYPPSPATYRLLDTVKTSRWAKNALCAADQLGQQFLDQMGAAEHRRRLHDHIRHRERLRCRDNLERERRLRTVFRRGRFQTARTLVPPAPTDLYARLCQLPASKVAPDFAPEDEITVMVESFQSAVRRVVPHLNLHLLQTQPLPEHIAKSARSHVDSSFRQKRRELQDRDTARSVFTQIEQFERMLNARQLQSKLSADSQA